VIYPILVGPYAEYFGTDVFMARLAAGTDGQMFDARSGGVAQALLAAITAIVTLPPPPPPPTDTTPPTVTVTLPAAPDGQGVYFNGSQTPVTGSVAGSDPANVSAITCTDSAGGLTLGPLVGGGTGTASRTLSVSGDGQHDITCTATDGIGNTGAAAGSANTGTVKIDASPPTASCTADPDTLWPPNDKLVAVATSVTMTDAGSGAGTSVLTSATSNEVGVDDIQSFTIGEPDVSGFLRAQRDGSGTGRIYTLSYTVTDVAGNTSTCDAQVSVPHDMRKG
jgi:hypothetical protein